MGRARRNLSDWINGYLELTEPSEPPRIYHLWCAIWALAASLERKVRLRWGHRYIYPNLYVILVGPSGSSRKGTALEYVQTLFRMTGIPYGTGGITRERLIQRFAESVTTYVDGSMRFQCSLIHIAPELINFLGEKNTLFLSALTEWFDAPERWVYDTKHGGTDVIRDMCFNLLGASDPTWFSKMFTVEAIAGGFTNRCLWVVSEGRQKRVPVYSVDEDLLRALSEDLAHIHTLAGLVRFEEEAVDLYSEWYMNTECPIVDPRFEGYVARRAVFLQKLSIVMSVSERSDLVVTRSHVERALDYLEKMELRLPSAFKALDATNQALLMERVFAYIRKEGMVTKSDLLRLYWREMDEYSYEVLARTLEGMKCIERIYQPEKRDEILKYVRSWD